MKAIVIHQHGGLDKLLYEEVPDPVPGPKEVLINVHATALNHVDIDVRNGTCGVETIQKLPHIPGVDAVGEVESIGSEVTMWKIGDRVSPHCILSCGQCAQCRSGKENICKNSEILGLTHWGGYAQKVAVKEHNLVPIPEAVSFEEAAAGMTPFATAWEGLIITAGLKAGETVMVTGAGGGVGSHAVQVAALAGADDVINYKNKSLVDEVMRLTDGKGVDVVLDGIGGDILKSSIKCLVDGGRIATIGAHGGEVVDVNFIEVFRKHITIHGCGRSTREIVSTVLELMARGKLKSIIHSSFSLEKATQAHALMESRNFFGRIILNP